MTYMDTINDKNHNTDNINATYNDNNNNNYYHYLNNKNADNNNNEYENHNNGGSNDYGDVDVISLIG